MSAAIYLYAICAKLINVEKLNTINKILIQLDLKITISRHCEPFYEPCALANGVAISRNAHLANAFREIASYLAEARGSNF